MLGLPPIGEDANSHIYVELSIGGQKLKTASKQEQLNPEWDETINFKDLAWDKSAGLTLKIYNGSTAEGKGEYLGQVAIPRGKLIEGTGFDLFGDGEMFVEVEEKFHQK